MMVESIYIVRGGEGELLAKGTTALAYIVTHTNGCGTRGYLWNWRYQKTKQLIRGCHPCGKLVVVRFGRKNLLWGDILEEVRVLFSAR